MKNICILGATGSIGTQALDVIRNDNELNLIAVSANTSWEKVLLILQEFNLEYVAMMDQTAYEKVDEYCRQKGLKTNVLYGIGGLNEIASLQKVDIVLTSVVGMIGLEPTLKAIRAKKDIALANKETLVVAGELITREAKKHNVNILPVDSEHGAIFQCLRGNKGEDVEKIILTASGGPFRGKRSDELRNVTVKEALNHPRWSMGKKISIDSATLMNKGLEVIEAHFLFDLDYNNIEVAVHPESIIHSMVQYKDGSIIAQLSVADMRLPIQYALNYPLRKKSIIDKLDLFKTAMLTFEKPDIDTFKPLKLAYEAGKIGGTMPAVLNAANEAAVDLFMKGHIKFLKIGDILEESMNKFDISYSYELEDIINLDRCVKEFVYSTYQ